MKILTGTILFIAVILCPLQSLTQDYHAIQGSVYAGGLGVHNNPASIVSSPFTWDITLIGAQVKSSSNLLVVRNYSLLSSAQKSEYLFKSGTYARYTDINANLNLLNARFALGRTRSLAFGANLRSYARAKSSAYSFIDTLQNTGQFFVMNEANRPLEVNFASSSWIELYGSYAQMIIDNSFGRLQAGISLKVSRGVSGAFSRVQNGQFARQAGTDPPSFIIQDAFWSYGYSRNFDRWKNSASLGTNLNNFLRYTEGGASIDAGAEFLVKSQAPITYDEDNYFDYEWKFGISVLDFGFNQYKLGKESRTGLGFEASVTDATLNQTFDSTIRSLATFNDSLATIAGNLQVLRGGFRIINPLRIVLNADRPLQQNFFINAELSLNLGQALPGNRMYVKEMSVFTLTPRWEKQRLGFYMPLTYNTHYQLWWGAAARVGPLLIGIHNLGHIFSKRSFPNGGGYLALILRSPRKTPEKSDKRLDCPPSLSYR